MIPRILLLLLTIGYLAIGSHRLVAQEPDAETQAKIAERDQLWKTAIGVAKAGQHAEALKLFEQFYENEQSLFGEASEGMVDTLGVMVRIARLQQDLQAVTDYCKRQHRVTEQLYGKTDYRTQDAARAAVDAEKDAVRSPEDRASLKQADKLGIEVFNRCRQGNYTGAISFAKQEMEIRKAVLGEQHPKYVTSLSKLAEVYRLMGDYPSAEQLYRQATEILKSVLGEQHPEYDESLFQLASLYQSVNDFARAEPLLRHMTEIRKAVLGEQHPDYADSLCVLAVLYQGMDDRARAEPLYLQALEIQRATLGERSPEYAISLKGLAYLYYSKRDFASAEPLFRQAVEIAKAAVGEQHPEYASSLGILGEVYRELGDYSRAEPLLRQSIQIAKSTTGEQHPDYAAKLSILASLYHTMGNHAGAEPLYRQAMEIHKTVHGEQHPGYATSLHNLAELYRSMADYARAEPLLTQANEIFKAKLGEQHPKYASSLNNLAELYRAVGDHARAESLYIQAMEIQKSVLGDQHPQYASTLNNLAELYRAIGNYERAEPLYVRSIAIQKVAYGEQHPNYIASVNNLGELYRSIGDHVRAEQLYLEATAKFKNLLGAQHPSYATSQNNLAMLYLSMGDYGRAEPLCRQAMEIRKAALGEQHPDYATSLNNLATLYNNFSDYRRAEPLYARAIGNSMRHLNETASILTEQQQISMTKSLRYRLDNSVSCALAMEPQPQSIARHLIAWKGAVLVRLRAVRQVSDDPMIADTFRQLQITTQQWSALSQAVPSPDKIAAWKSQIAELTQKKAKLDAELMRRSATYRNSQKKVSLDEVRQAIPADGVIVDYFEYGGKQGRMLMATVVRRDADPVMVDLGLAETAGQSIRRWRSSLGADAEAVEAGGQLRKQLWEPLLPYIDDAKLVFVSTDGLLGNFPFAALPGKAAGSYLIEDQAIVMLPVPILLPKLMERDANESQLMANASASKVTGVLMGAVDYDSVDQTEDVPTTPTIASGPMSLASRTRGGLTWGPLTETGTEIDSIAKLFGGEVIQLRKREATESAFLEAAGKANWLHLATHGFFAPPEMKNAVSAEAIAKSQKELSGFSGDEKDQFLGYSPGQLSGLVFAGANRPPRAIDPLAPVKPMDDGILTADEIAYLQLEHVELAVLSACETGLGETAGGEGILGLQRAFQIAGARSTATSLWKVDDAATRALMVEFYRNLFEKKLSKLESLRQAQIWLLNNPDVIEGHDLTTRGTVQKLKPLAPGPRTVKPTRSLPAYWAAFQLSGDPR